jgi:serine protease AprX
VSSVASLRSVPRRLAALVAAGAALSVAVAAPVTPTTGATAPSLRAVVSLAGNAAVDAPGVKVLSVLPHVGIEIVTGTPEALRGLARHAGVTGISPDTRLSLTSQSDGGTTARGVFAWQQVGGGAGRPTAGSGVTVAVLDTGVSDTPALNRASKRLVDGVDTSRLLEGGEARTNGTFTDGYGHGTFMANLIAGGPVAGVPNNRGLGVAPNARVVVVKVADDSGATALSEVLAGMDWVAAQAPKIQVLSIALGHDRPGTAYGADPLTEAVDHVMDDGVLVVAAAGNTPGEVSDPGLTPRAITVGAADLTGKKDVVAPFSGSADVQGVAKPDVVASGVDLYSYLPGGSVVGRKHRDRDSGFNRGSGTSESTSVTAGAIAVLLSDNPDARLVDVKPLLRVAADRVSGGSQTQGQGLLDIDRGFRPLGNGRHGNDPTGEAGLDTTAWWDNAWLGGSWRHWLEDAWSANSWAAGGAWQANSWSANSWGSATWSANSWSANSWSANSWSASSWSANSWSASSWAANSWSASSWSASSWSAGSWASVDWGDDS